MQCFLHEEMACLVSSIFNQNKNYKICNFCYLTILASNKNYNIYNFCGSLISCSNKNYKICKFFTYFVWLCTYSQESENKESKRRKVCRCGAGVEQTPDKCDTPGFPLRTEPELVHDLRGFDRLDLPQNHKRIVASSRWLLQGWRANCDIQVLL